METFAIVLVTLVAGFCVGTWTARRHHAQLVQDVPVFDSIDVSNDGKHISLRLHDRVGPRWKFCLQSETAHHLAAMLMRACGDARDRILGVADARDSMLRVSALETTNWSANRAQGAFLVLTASTRFGPLAYSVPNTSARSLAVAIRQAIGDESTPQ